MSEQKPTTRRRAITIPNREPDNNEYTLNVENSASEPKPAKENEKAVVEENQPTVKQPEQAVEAAPVEYKNEVSPETINKMNAPVTDENFKEPTEEEWAKKIEEAKRESTGVPPVRYTDGNNAAVAQQRVEESVKDKTNEIIEQEVQRRLAIELEKKNAATAQPQQNAQPQKPVTGLTDEQKAKIASENDVSNFVNIALGDDNDFLAAFERELDEDTRPESERTSDPTPYAAGMAVVRQLGQTNNQQRLLAQWIGSIMEKNTNALKGVEKEMRLARITPKIGDGTGPKKLTGATARAAVISRMKGMFRVQLYNSGFWLDLRPPTLIDLDGWMGSIDTEFKELGRVLGGHAHAVIDVYVKQKFFDILPQLVQRSNFDGYNDPVKLVANISFHDYDTLLWAMCCMIFRDGVGAGVYCTNPDCRFVDEHQYVDLRNICFLNTEIFNPRAMEWMTRGAHAGSKMLSEEDLKQYREEILGFKKTVTIDDGQTVYELRVPTMKEFIDESSSMVSKMEKLLNGNHDITSDIVSNQLTFHLYKMLTPWIRTLSLYDEAGNLQYQIPDREAIYDSLDVDHLEGSKTYEEITDFVRDTKISFYSSTTLKCPKCGKVADLKHDNMYPLDMQYLFFCLSCHMLEQTGASY